MATPLANSIRYSHRFSTALTFISPEAIQQSIKSAIDSKTYDLLPEILSFFDHSNPNPFTFLSKYPQTRKTQVVDEILKSFINLPPRSHPKTLYSLLLSQTLQGPESLPLALAILQRTLRSGFTPIPQTHLFLSSAWLQRRNNPDPVANILNEMRLIGYSPDCITFNYLVLSLCLDDKLDEASNVLHGMASSGCPPNLNTYGTLIRAMARSRKSSEAFGMVKEMVLKFGLTPRQDTVVRVARGLRACGENWKSVEMIVFLEKKGCEVGFEGYEVVVRGCLERCEFVLAGKVVMMMTGRGFIPYIGVRNEVIEGLVRVGESGLACAVRLSFTNLRS